MIIDFNYDKKNINYVSGYIFKGKNYRCSFIRYKTLYKNPAKGTEFVELYNYEPKGEVKASSIVLHGLGSRNIKFLLWLGPHLASAGVNTTILILPGNYTRVEDNSVSGKSFLYPDINLMFQFWEHAVVDVLSTIDLLEQNNLWKENNILTGYCLGGMISTIVASIRKDISHTLLMTTGGHVPKIMHESPTTQYVRRLFNKNKDFDYNLNNKEKLYNIYEKDFEKVKKMSLDELFTSSDIHPLLKIDPLSYAQFLDKNKLTIVDALFDSTLPVDSRKMLYNELKDANRKIIPVSHVSWLPFSYFLAKYILHKVKITDKESTKMLLGNEKIENPLEK